MVAQTPETGLGTLYLSGLGIDEALARLTPGGDRVQLTDALGSVLAEVDESGQTTSDYAYSPYGETRATGETGNPVRYTGREDDGTGLYYYRARYYDPQLKRFISEDPIGLAGGRNVYAYVAGKPLTHSDPQGLVEWSGSFSGVAAISGAGAGFYQFELTSECKCNKRVKIKGVVSSVAAGVGMKYTIGKGGVSFYDYRDCPDPDVVRGGFAMLAISSAIGGGGSCSKITLGHMYSKASCGPVYGVDISAGIYFGNAYVTNVETSECCEL